MKKKILVVDIGGTHVKLMISRRDTRKFDSGMKRSPRQLVAGIKENTQDWNYDASRSDSRPSSRKAGSLKKRNILRPAGSAWTSANRSANRPASLTMRRCRRSGVIAAAACFSWGSALAWVQPYYGTAICCPSSSAICLTRAALLKRSSAKLDSIRLGKKEWARQVLYCLKQLKLSFIADYVVVGGGLVNEFDTLPDGLEPGDNKNVYLGGVRLWESDPKSRRPKWNIL